MTTPDQPATVHDHEWRDTGFADLDECACGATRSATTGRVIEREENESLAHRIAGFGLSENVKVVPRADDI